MRNTYDSKNPFGKGVPSSQDLKDLETYSVQPKMSYQKHAQGSQASNNEKMTKSIIDALKKINEINEKSISITQLKPNQKTLLSTIAVFINSFDDSFDESFLNLQNLPEILRALGYPNTISKTYFQPVGAPHTWGHCLVMMDWLAQLASFHLQIKANLQDGQIQPDFTSLLIQSHLENNPAIVRDNLEQNIEKKEKMIQEHKYNIKTLQIEILNQKVQKQLSVMDAEQKHLESVLNRQIQQTIQIDQQNKEIEKKIKTSQIVIDEQKKIVSINQQQIVSLNQEIQNQELSVEEVEKIRFKIKEFHNKLTELKRQDEIQKQSFEIVDNKIINQYIEFSQILQKLRHMRRIHKYEMDKRNIYMNIPENNVELFSEFVKDRKNDISEQKMAQILGIPEIQEIKIKGERLLETVESELKQLERQRQSLQKENRQLNDDLIQKQIQNSSQSMNLNEMKSKAQILLVEANSHKERVSFLENQIKLLEQEKRQLQNRSETQAREGQDDIQEIRKLINLKHKLQNQKKESIAKMKQEFDSSRIKTLEMIQQEYGYMEECVNQMNEIDFSEDQYFQQNSEPENSNFNSNTNTESNTEDKIEVFRSKFTDNFGKEFQQMIALTGAYESPRPQKIKKMKTLEFNSLNT